MAEPIESNRTEETKEETARKVEAQKAFCEDCVAKTEVVHEEAAKKKRWRAASGASSSSKPTPKSARGVDLEGCCPE